MPPVRPSSPPASASHGASDTVRKPPNFATMASGVVCWNSAAISSLSPVVGVNRDAAVARNVIDTTAARRPAVIARSAMTIRAFRVLTNRLPRTAINSTTAPVSTSRPSARSVPCEGESRTG